MRVLLAEDAIKKASELSLLLSSMELVVDRVGNTQIIEEMFLSDAFDLIIFASRTQGTKGVDLVRKYRAKGGQSPVLVILDSGSTNECIETLNSGADDCINKPYNLLEVGARVRALLRRNTTEKSRNIVYGPLMWDTVSRTFWLDGELLDITPKEKAVLEVFAQNPGKILTKELIANKVYSFNDYADLKAISLYIHRLRQKIVHDEIAIETLRSQGYRLAIKKLNCNKMN